MKCDDSGFPDTPIISETFITSLYEWRWWCIACAGLPWLETLYAVLAGFNIPLFNGICSIYLVLSPLVIVFDCAWSSFSLELDPHRRITPTLWPCMLRNCRSWCSARSSASSVPSLYCLVSERCFCRVSGCTPWILSASLWASTCSVFETWHKIEREVLITVSRN